MRTRRLAPVGVEVTSVDLAAPSSELVGRLPSLLAEHGVAVFPDQDIDDAAFLGFLRRFGDPVFTTGETPVPDFPDLNVITNVGRTTPPRSTFHVDTSYVARPPAYTALRAVSIPSAGGQTLFSNQYLAHDTLPAPLREQAADRTIRHVVTGVSGDAGDETAAEHPILRRHPVSGRTSLYLSTPARCASVSGLSSVEAAELVSALFDHSTAPSNLLRHSWSPVTS